MNKMGGGVSRERGISTNFRIRRRFKEGTEVDDDRLIAGLVNIVEYRVERNKKSGRL